MNSRTISLILLTVTVGLLVTVGYLAWLLRTDPNTRWLRRTQMVTNTITQIAVRKINATNLLAALANRLSSWAALESTNYAVYAANLRAFGCPEETIKDIILTDVAKQYGRRRAALREQFEPYQFWRTDSISGSSHPQLQRQLLELDREQRALIRELLGVDARTEMSRYFSDEDMAQRAYAFLPAAKQPVLQELIRDYEELEQEIYLRSRGLFLEDDDAELRKLHRERDAEMAQLLTPEELEEYHLRNSETANSLRAQLSGFDASEEEFRKIFRLQKSFDDQVNGSLDAASGVSEEARSRAQEEAQAALDDELRKTIGEKRLNEYRRAQDADYKVLLQLSERFEMSPEAAARVYDMKAEAERLRQRIEANVNLPDDQRQAALDAIRRETERSVSGVLGERVFKAYQRTGGQWIPGLSAASPNVVIESDGDNN